jgi:hypothetical protein
MLPVAEHRVEFTVTRQVPDLLLPSVEVAVIFAVPADIPVTKPELLTVATEELLDDQVRFVLVAFEGKTAAVIVVDAPAVTAIVAGRLILPTSTDEDVPIGDNTVPGITSEGEVPVCPGFNHPTARLSGPPLSVINASM